MADAFAILVFLVASLVSAYAIADARHRRFLCLSLLASWAFTLPLMAAANTWMPFSGTGDDDDYFEISTVLHDHGSLVDPYILSRHYEQIGYPWALNAIHLTLGSGLLGLKTFNFLCFHWLVLVWYRILLELEPDRVARRFVGCALLLTPLWFYFIFLLKDLPIALLQALFVFGVAMTLRRRAGLLGWILQGVSLVLLIPFRAQLVAQNVAVGVGAHAVRAFGSGSLVRRISIAVSGLCVGGTLLYLASDPRFVGMLGVRASARVVGSHAMWQQADAMIHATERTRVFFPAIYLLSEVSGLSAFSPGAFDQERFRGLLALPWIALVVPMLPLGARWMLLPARDTRTDAPAHGGLTSMRCMATPWSVVVLFILASMTVSWIVGDTTRWRLSDMPALLAVAVAGATHSGGKRAGLVLLLWLTSLACIFPIYYLWRSG